MKRKFLLNAIDELKNTDNIESAIDALKDLAVDFCDNYETEFNDISDHLDGALLQIPAVRAVKGISDKCGSDLY